MSMQERPAVSVLPDGGRYWTHDYGNFSVMVYVPVGDPRAEIINFGFFAPYLLVFGDPARSIADAVEYAAFDLIAARKQNRPVLRGRISHQLQIPHEGIHRDKHPGRPFPHRALRPGGKRGLYCPLLPENPGGGIPLGARGNHPRRGDAGKPVHHSPAGKAGYPGGLRGQQQGNQRGAAHLLRPAAGAG